MRLERRTCGSMNLSQGVSGMIGLLVSRQLFSPAGQKSLRKSDNRISYAKNHAFPVVRRPGGEGREILHFDFQEFKDWKNRALWKRGIRGPWKAAGNCNDCGIRDRRAEIRSVKRWAAIQVHRGRIICCRL